LVPGKIGNAILCRVLGTIWVTRGEKVAEQYHSPQPDASEVVTKGKKETDQASLSIDIEGTKTPESLEAEEERKPQEEP